MTPEFEIGDRVRVFDDANNLGRIASWRPRDIGNGAWLEYTVRLADSSEIYAPPWRIVKLGAVDALAGLVRRSE